MEHTKAQRTLQSRQRHWLKFLSQHEINNTKWHTFSADDKDLIFACYAVYLIDGNTLKSISISANTLKLYLNAAGAKVFHRSICMHQRGYKSHSLSGYSPLLNTVVQEHNRWMKVPNRREPVTKNMILFWIDKFFDKQNPTSLEAALLDWMIIGTKAGF